MKARSASIHICSHVSCYYQEPFFGDMWGRRPLLERPQQVPRLLGPTQEGMLQLGFALWKPMDAWGPGLIRT